jgi:hypothetical protein
MDPVAPDPKKADDAAPMARPPSQRSDAGSMNGVMREFLTWIARCQRTEADVMEAWRSTCPRLTLWEDALAAQLVKVERGVGMRMGEARVTLTPRGQAVVAGPRSPSEIVSV